MKPNLLSTEPNCLESLNKEDLYREIGLFASPAFLPTWQQTALSLFFLGLLGIVCNYKNFLTAMLCMEVMYLGIILAFSVGGSFTSDPVSTNAALLILILAACESAVGLGILVVLYRFGRSIEFDAQQQLGG